MMVWVASSNLVSVAVADWQAGYTIECGLRLWVSVLGLSFAFPVTVTIKNVNRKGYDATVSDQDYEEEGHLLAIGIFDTWVFEEHVALKGAVPVWVADVFGIRIPGLANFRRLNLDNISSVDSQNEGQYAEPFHIQLQEGVFTYGSSLVNATGSLNTSGSSMALHGTVIPTAIDWMETLGVHVQAEYGEPLPLFFYVPNVGSWAAGRAACQSHGGDLASIHSAEENAAVWAVVPRSTALWLGATDAASEGTWVWIDGTPFDFSNWYPGEPNNSGGNEDCALLWSGLNNSEWADDTCGAFMNSIGGVCRKQNQGGLFSLKQGKIAYGSSSVNATGSVDVSGSSMAVHGTVVPSAIDWMETLGVHVQAEYG
eukprot:jgi/Chrpa1/21872/Chrysochromulina_OHIO_Genome00026121-RA